MIFHIQFSILFSTLRIQEMPKFYLARSKDSQLWPSSVLFALICHILCPIRGVFISQVTLCSSLVVFRVFFLLIFTLIKFETICEYSSGVAVVILEFFCCHFFFMFIFVVDTIADVLHFPPFAHLHPTLPPPPMTSFLLLQNLNISAPYLPNLSQFSCLFFFTQISLDEFFKRLIP